MFPKPIEKSSRTWQLCYQALLPTVMLLWLAPLLAVALFSIRPDSDFLIGNYWGWPSSFEMIKNYGMVFSSAMPRYIMNSFLITIPTVVGAVIY
jgi:multiple sugar transport system permease protein